MCISVLLPLPEVPMIATNSPRSMRSETPSSARTITSSVSWYTRSTSLDLDDRRGPGAARAPEDSRSASGRREAAATAAAEAAAAEPPKPPPPSPPPPRRLPRALLSWLPPEPVAPARCRGRADDDLSRRRSGR